MGALLSSAFFFLWDRCVSEIRIMNHDSGPQSRRFVMPPTSTLYCWDIAAYLARGVLHFRRRWYHLPQSQSLQRTHWPDWREWTSLTVQVRNRSSFHRFFVSSRGTVPSASAQGPRTRCTPRLRIKKKTNKKQRRGCVTAPSETIVDRELCCRFPRSGVRHIFQSIRNRPQVPTYVMKYNHFDQFGLGYQLSKAKEPSLLGGCMWKKDESLGKGCKRRKVSSHESEKGTVVAETDTAYPKDTAFCHFLLPEELKAYFRHPRPKSTRLWSKATRHHSDDVLTLKPQFVRFRINCRLPFLQHNVMWCLCNFKKQSLLHWILLHIFLSCSSPARAKRWDAGVVDSVPCINKD